jgi:hypothetical protein
VVDGSGARTDLRPFAAVDLDGVVADVRHRLHHLDSWPKDWDGFFAAAVDDPVLPEGRAVVDRLLGEGQVVVWMTGRPERCRRDTESWLRRNGLPEGALNMRPDGDRRPARTTKLAIARRLSADRPLSVVVDDDEAVVQTLRQAGFTVLHAQWMATQPSLFEAQESEGRT